MLEAELAAEQAHLDEAYARLEVLQARARQLARAEWSGHSKTPAAMLERDAREAHGTRRLGSLRVDGGLCFGRIDRTSGETFHIGRVGVSDDDQRPLVVDWRAPVAEPFYRATPRDPLGLVRRRHLLTRGRKVVGIEDEPLDLDAGEARRRNLVLVGEAALISALTERRTGRMRDIVATIQAEQDAIVRSPLGGVLVVQGGPGTGKTAVALHRAAFLLYRHRFPLEEQGVLVVGPNPIFLRYIERVLPSLGESRCRLATIDDLHRCRAEAPERDRGVARIKGDLRMADVIANAIGDRERPLIRTAVLGVGAHRLRIGPRATRRIIDAARARPGTHNERRRFVDEMVVRHLVHQYEKAVVRAKDAGLPVSPLPTSEVRERLRSSRSARELADRMWPVLTSEALLDDLFGHEPLLSSAARGVLSGDEVARLVRPAGSPWTTSDLPLLDEADVLVGPSSPRGPRPAAKPLEDASAMVDRVLAHLLPHCHECDQELTFDLGRDRWVCGTFGCGAVYRSEEVMSPEAALQVRDLQRVLRAQAAPDESWEPVEWFATYGHVVVDEAQEVSPMQWRMLARRCPSRSMTVVGDVAQGSGPSATGSWTDVFAALDTDDARARVVELTVNYRTPSEVMELADRVAGLAASASCVRSSGHAPRFVATDEPLDSLPGMVAKEVGEADGGKLAVIADRELVPAIEGALDIHPSDDPLDGAVAVLDAEGAKGLEFDSVIVVEPARLDRASLYVALTRTTTRLTVVHAEPLPAAFATSGTTR